MRTLITSVFLAVVLVTSAQEAQKSSNVKFQGGIWSGTNGQTSLIGVPAAKISAMFVVNEKVKLETGLTLIPGLISDKAGERLGLSAGGTVTIRKDTWKLKPIIGVVLVKTYTWQLLPGIGFVF